MNPEPFSIFKINNSYAKILNAFGFITIFAYGPNNAIWQQTQPNMAMFNAGPTPVFAGNDGNNDLQVMGSMKGISAKFVFGSGVPSAGSPAGQCGILAPALTTALSLFENDPSGPWMTAVPFLPNDGILPTKSMTSVGSNGMPMNLQGGDPMVDHFQAANGCDMMSNTVSGWLQGPDG